MTRLIGRREQHDTGEQDGQGAEPVGGTGPAPDALPPPPRISSRRRRFFGFFLDALILAGTIMIGWYLWSLVRYRALRGPGKQLLGMAVADGRTFQKPSWKRGLVRSAAKWILYSQILVCIAMVRWAVLWLSDTNDFTSSHLDEPLEFLFVLIPVPLSLYTAMSLVWDRQRQALWDKVAGTLVVDVPRRPRARGSTGRALRRWAARFGAGRRADGAAERSGGP